MGRKRIEARLLNPAPFFPIPVYSTTIIALAMEDIPVHKIIRSRRRTIALIITPEARLIVRAPLKAPASMIDEFVSNQHSWIRKKIAEMKGRPQVIAHAYEEGEVFWFLGRPYPLHFVDEAGAAIERTDRLCVSLSLVPDIRHRLKLWYMAEAAKEIRSRCMWFSMMTGYSPASVRITDARQRWGSCTHKGGLNFSWRLIQAPLEIVDYVIVHELVHLRQPDHSPRFWAKVEALMPDYKRRRKWLRENERLLRI
jgi:predicted metal-dependent hydrolase